MGWTWGLYETLTGRLLRTVTPTGVGSWRRRPNEKTGDSSEFPIDANPGIWQACAPGESTLVCSWDGTPLYAGIVWDRTYSKGSRTVTLEHEDIRSLWDVRMIFNQTWSGKVTEGKLTYSGLSQRALAQRLVFQGMTGPGGQTAGYRLPVILDALDQTGGHGVEKLGYDFPLLGDALKELAEREGGPDIDFLPRFTADGNLEWVMDVWLSRSTGIDLYADAKRTQVSDLTLTSSGRHKATELHVTGEGSEVDIKHARRYDTDPDGPATARLVTDPQLRYSTDVESRANAEYAARQSTVQQTGMTISIPGEISPTDLMLGMTVTFFTTGDPVFQDGPHPRELIGWGPSGPNKLSLELGEIRVASA